MPLGGEDMDEVRRRKGHGQGEEEARTLRRQQGQGKEEDEGVYLARTWTRQSCKEH